MLVCKAILYEANIYSIKKHKAFEGLCFHRAQYYCAAACLLEDKNGGMVGRLKQRLSLSREQSELVIDKLVEEKIKGRSKQKK